PSRWDFARRASPKAPGLTVEVLEARALPGFVAPVNYDTGVPPGAMMTANLTGDAHLDLVALGDHNVTVLLGNVAGTFGAAASFAVGSNASSFALGDFNGDGKLDIVTANLPDNSLSILLGNGDGTFQPARTINLGLTPRFVVVGDFNGDGKLDIATTN